MGGQQCVRQDIDVLAREARLRSRAYRALLQVLIAGIASTWIGWWALLWIAVIQILERFIEPALMHHVISPLAAKAAGKAEQAMAALRALTGAAYAMGWAPAWAAGGDAAGFFAGAMLVGAFVNALVYFSNSRLVFAAALAPPLLAGLLVPALSSGFGWTHVLVLATLLVVLLRTQRAQRDQMALFESVDQNRAARAEAEAASRAKSQFMATMTHELRTPLNAIINYAEMLEEDLAPDRARLAEDAARIHRSGMGLLGLIDNVLNYALIEAGEMRIDACSTNVRAVLAAALDAATPLANVNNNVVTSHIADDIGWDVIDERRLTECLAALLSNACRFTNGGRVNLVAAYDGDANERCLRIGVEDTGCGIAKEHLQHLFDPFYQADSALTRKHDGFGLGLAITRKVARLMGGDLTVTSEPGRGSRFILTLKCGVSDPLPLAAQQAA